jgi:hypothetical protein
VRTVENVKKEKKGGSQIPEKCLYLEISSVRDLSLGRTKFWLLIVDESKDYRWSKFLKEMSELKVKMITLLTDFNTTAVNINVIDATSLKIIRSFNINVSQRD